MAIDVTPEETDHLLERWDQTDPATQRKIVVQFIKQLAAVSDGLEELVKLQGHYAGLLNAQDGGKRHQFKTGQEWLDRLVRLGTLPAGTASAATLEAGEKGDAEDDKPDPADPPPTKAADARGVELATGVAVKDLPPLAREHRDRLAAKFGMCGEVCITALSHYAEIVEGLPPGDPAYACDPESRAFLRRRMNDLGIPSPATNAPAAVEAQEEYIVRVADEHPRNLYHRIKQTGATVITQLSAPSPGEPPCYLVDATPVQRAKIEISPGVKSVTPNRKIKL